MNARQNYLITQAKDKLKEDLRKLGGGSTGNPKKQDAISTCKQVLDALIADCYLVEHEPTLNYKKVKFKKIGPSIYSVWLE